MLLRCTLIFVVVTGAEIGEENEQLCDLGGAQVLVCFVLCLRPDFVFARD